MRPAADLLTLAERVLGQVPDGDAEVRVTEEQLALTRFARNAIHQNVAERSLRVRLRLIADGRVGVAELRSEADDLPARIVEAADRARRLSPPGEVSPLPAGGADPVGPVAYSPATVEASPDLRADAVAVVSRTAAARGFEAFGAFSTAAEQTAIINTSGVRRQGRSTRADFVSVVRGPEGAGYADRHSHDVSAIDPEELAAEVVDTTARNQGAVAMAPGEYEVVLSPYAVADLLEHLSWVGFSALAHQEGRSFMRPGEKLMSEKVTIDDDASDRDREPYPFDCEGVATQPVSIVEAGVCRGFVHDTATALRAGVASTGHALPMPNTFGPQARHLAIAPGDRSVEELIGDTRQGLFVTRLWYVRTVHPLRTTITGMTREGTFLIENGRLGSPVRDLRFTQSIVEALSDVRGVSRERSLHRAETENAVLIPYLHLGRFSFTS